MKWDGQKLEEDCWKSDVRRRNQDNGWSSDEKTFVDGGYQLKSEEEKLKKKDCQPNGT